MNRLLVRGVACDEIVMILREYLVSVRISRLREYLVYPVIVCAEASHCSVCCKVKIKIFA